MKLKYDDGGYMLTRGNMAMTWDYYGRCTEVKKDGKTVSRAWYNNQAVRVIKEENGLHTFYIDPLFEIRGGVGVTFAKLGHDRVAEVRSTKIAANMVLNATNVAVSLRFVVVVVSLLIPPRE